jgi:hypothetical protein
MLAALVSTLLSAGVAEAGGLFIPPSCDLGCAAAVDGALAVGGVATAVGAQLSLVRGKPSASWAHASLALSGANAIGGAILLVVAAVVDDDDRLPFLVLGTVQMGIALTGLISGAQAEAALPPNLGPAGPTPRGPDPASLGIQVRF